MHSAHIKIKFLGGLASDNLTGSCILLLIEQGKRSTRILIDAGLIQCCFSDFLVKNQEVLKQLRLDKIDSIILTHSHIDHIGRLPLFVKYGFKGRLFCTEWTEKLLKVMLEDSAKIQLAEIGYLSAKAKKELAKHKDSYNSKSLLSCGKYDHARLKAKQSKNKKIHYDPLYTIKDVEMVEELVKNGGYEYYEWINLAHNVKLKFYPSGHVIGSSIVVLKISDGPQDTHLCFTGDLGRRDGIILPPPVLPKEPINFLITESTYGGITHTPRDQEIKSLLDLVKVAAVNKQRIIIPSFALERAQEIIYLLSFYMDQKTIPFVPVFLNSPLASKITEIFSAAWRRGMFSDQGNLSFNPFSVTENPYLRLATTIQETDILAAQANSYIVVASSGMCEAGPVRSHLKANLSKSDTVVCLIGHMAKGSLGQRLKDLGASKIVKMNGREIIVKANINIFDSFSAHADGPFLVDYANSTLAKYPNLTKKVFIVHGEEDGAKILKANLEARLNKKNDPEVKVVIPKINEEFVLK